MDNQVPSIGNYKVNLTKKFQSWGNTHLWNKSFWLDAASHTKEFNQSEFIIQSNHSTILFRYNENSGYFSLKELINNS